MNDVTSVAYKNKNIAREMVSEHDSDVNSSNEKGFDQVDDENEVQG